MTLIPTGLLGRLGGFFTASCTIQSRNAGATNAIGEVVNAGWSAVGGLGSIPCAVVPNGDNELLRQPQTFDVSDCSIVLQGHYPAITASMRAMVGSDVYNIVGIDHDSQGLHTTLRAKVVRP